MTYRRALDRVRGWLGESQELTEVRAELARAATRMLAVVAERDGALAWMREDRQACADLVRAADAAVRRAHEPVSEHCDKIRLRDQDEAAAFAILTEQDLCLQPGSFTVYRCAVCPRHPVTSDRAWHVANADPTRRTSNPTARRAERAARAKRSAQNGQLVKQRISPEIVARLRLAHPTPPGDTLKPPGDQT